MKTFKDLNINDALYIVRCFKSNKIYEYDIETAVITNKVEDECGVCDFYIDLNGKTYKVYVVDVNLSDTRSWLQQESGDDDMCELYVDKNMAIEHMKNTYINHMKDIDKHIERLNNRKIDYKEALERWEKRF